MAELNLSEKMEKWGELIKQINELEQQIILEVLALRKTQKVGDVIAKYSIGRGNYDYKNIAQTLEPDEEVIQKYTESKIDWRKVCEETGKKASNYEEIKKRFYVAGNAYVSIGIDHSGNDK